MNPRVTEAIPHDDYSLELVFANGERKRYDVKPLLGRGVFNILKDLNIFKSVRLSYGTVQWLGEIDICPDTLYEESVELPKS